MSRNRSDFPAALLGNGKVLVAGGSIAGSTRNGVVEQAVEWADLYDAPSNTWTAVANMRVARIWHTLSTLRDGRVLVAGGLSRGANGLSHSSERASAEIIDPVGGTWSTAAPMDAMQLAPASRACLEIMF
jgi:hypothetical protein